MINKKSDWSVNKIFVSNSTYKYGLSAQFGPKTFPVNCWIIYMIYNYSNATYHEREAPVYLYIQLRILRYKVYWIFLFEE